MSRYTGPRVKICRALGVDLPGLTRRTIERRPFPPGQHGQGRKKVTEYGLRLKEKQKIRLYYGVTERQLRRVMSEAIRSKTASGDKLIELLERRLDNAVFRAGFARTIPHARQLVAHGHVRVNGRRVDIPSFRVSAGDELSLNESARKNQGVQAAVANIDTLARAQWLSTDTAALTAKIVTLPDVSAPLFPINLQLVVEFYSLRLLQKPCGSGGARLSRARPAHRFHKRDARPQKSRAATVPGGLTLPPPTSPRSVPLPCILRAASDSAPQPPALLLGPLTDKTKRARAQHQRATPLVAAPAPCRPSARQGHHDGAPFASSGSPRPCPERGIRRQRLAKALPQTRHPATMARQGPASNAASGDNGSPRPCPERGIRRQRLAKAPAELRHPEKLAFAGPRCRMATRRAGPAQAPRARSPRSAPP